MNPLLRIIDANANRAREALRCLEDVARFGRDDPHLTERFKALRHGLAGALAAFDPLLLLASRDTEGDVGTSITGATEGSRAGLRGVAMAAGSRLGEALRSMEEAAKAAGQPGAASGLERLRYESYAAVQALATGLAGQRRQYRLCVLITEALCRHLPWEQVARLALEGGADCLQLREKTMDKGEQVRRARRLVELVRPHGAHVIVNDHADVALAAGANGVHVGQSDLPVEDVRRIAGGQLLVGVSTENLDQARAAWAAGADLCGVGPMFPTTTKDKPRLAGPAYLQAFLREPKLADMPHLAIGGITPANVNELAAVGCRGVAVSSCVLTSNDPAGVCARLLRGLGEA